MPLEQHRAIDAAAVPSPLVFQQGMLGQGPYCKQNLDLVATSTADEHAKSLALHVDILTNQNLIPETPLGQFSCHCRGPLFAVQDSIY